MDLVEIESVSNRNLIKVGIKVKSQRNLKKITQDELSEISGVHKSVISRIENPNNIHNCELLSILRLAAALKISPYKFFDFSDLE